jgi:hypothetical protein
VRRAKRELANYSRGSDKETERAPLYPRAEYANIIHEFRVRDECFVPIDIPRERSSLLPRLFSLSFSFSLRRQSAEHVRE